MNFLEIFKNNLFRDVQPVWERYSKDDKIPMKFELALQAIFIPISLSVKKPSLRLKCRLIYDFMYDLMSILTDDDKDNSSQFEELVDYYEAILPSLKVS